MTPRDTYGNNVRLEVIVGVNEGCTVVINEGYKQQRGNETNTSFHRTYFLYCQKLGPWNTFLLLKVRCVPLY